MLGVRCYFDIISQFDSVSEDDIMCSEAFTQGEVRIVDMVEGADELGVAVAGVEAELFFDYSGKGVGYWFVFEDSPAGHKPKAPGWLIITHTDKDLASVIFDNQVDRDQRRQSDDLGQLVGT